MQARAYISGNAVVIGTFLWILFAYRLSLSATEFSLQALCVTIITFVYLRWFRKGSNPTDHKYLVLGILVSIAFLACIEFLLLALSLGLFFLRTHRKLLFFAVPSILVFSVYAVTNSLLFKCPFPISGVVKLAWSDYYLSQNPVFQNQGWLAAKIDLALLPVRGLFALRPLSEMLLPGYLVLGSYGAAILLAAAWVADRIGSHQLYRRIKPLAPFILYSLFCVQGYVILFQDFLAFTPWYFVIQPWLVAIMCAILLHAISDWLLLHWRAELANNIVLVVIVLLSISTAAYTLRSISFPISPSENKPNDPLEKAALWLRDNTPRDAVVGSWNAGIISYYSQRRVVNLDGLVNSWDYFQRAQYDLCRYWEENGIAFVADVFDAQRALSPMPSYPYYKKCADQMVPIWSDDVQGINRQVQIYFLRR